MRNVAALLCGFAVFSASPTQDRLWHLRNLGKAFYENPTTQVQAVEQFRLALALNPTSARERVNYGLALLKAGELQKGAQELVRAQKQDPSIPHTWFSLGVQDKRTGEYRLGIEQMQGMLKLVPADAKAHYNLAALLKLDGKQADALREFEQASRLNPNLAAPHFQLYNAYRQAGRPADAAKELEQFQAIKKRAGSPIAEDMESSEYTEIYDRSDGPRPALPDARFSDKVLARGVIGVATAGATLFAWNAEGVKSFRFDVGTVNGLEKVKGVRSIVPAGDDICILTEGGAALYRIEKGEYRKLAVTFPEGAYRQAIWIDYDHDYDLDLMLLGDQPVLMRNNGDGTWTDVTKQFPFVAGKAMDAVHFALRPDTAARDLVVTYADRDAVVYEDRLNGQFQAVPLPELKAGTLGLAAADFNRDSFIDLLAGSVYLENEDGHLKRGAIPAGVNVAASIAAKEWIRATVPPARELGALEQHVALLGEDGSLHFLRRTAPVEHWLVVELEGVKNVKSARTATVEVKAGALYEKKIYVDGPLYFRLDQYGAADTVRITWPNGLIQNEPRKRANERLKIVEAERLSGSCPMIFTWNGSGFTFVTDVLGVAPLGASSADGTYFPVDHDEYIQIPGGALQKRNGDYEIRITEELHEVSYLDQLRLIALDHPAGTQIFTNDKFKSPPFPEFRLFGVKRRIYPTQARDGNGLDVRPALLKQDLRYPAGFRRDLSGAADLHALDLDFAGAALDGRAVLILNGWVDWADGSTFRGTSQRKGGGLVFPSLQMKNRGGEWQTVIADMGMPSGKPKSIAVDLSGKWLSASREVRIVTNLCVYWDEIFLSEENGEPEVRLTGMDPSEANVHYRGFSTPVIDPERKQPERFEYARLMPPSSWNPTVGMYTRYGDVRELVAQIDDKLLVMGAGDEVTLRYKATALPPLLKGWTREFLLLVDGWAKDADANTAFGQTVEPLPFHGMTGYPYGKEESFPRDASHEQYRREYQTRPALRLVRPLRETISE
jgi:tetratricopeptide (TPR) repeat protein